MRSVGGPPNAARSFGHQLKSRDFSEIGKALLTRWGFFYFTFVSVITFFKLLDPSTRGHYRVFTGAARAMWNEQPAYFTDFGWQNGLEWFYSPACGLTFYLPFSFLPETVGVILNVVFMWAVFVWGTSYFFNAALDTPKFDFVPLRSLNLFWFFIASEMIGAIASEKTEILMVGLCLFAVGLLIRGRQWWPAFILAMVTNWKFQPLALVGLLVLSLIFYRRNFRFLFEFVFGSVVFLVVPYAMTGTEYLGRIYPQWMQAVQNQLITQWKSFDHVYNVARILGGVEVTYSAIQMVAFIVAVGMVSLLVTDYALYRRGKSGSFTSSACLALSLAATFMTSFSPLSQSNGYILVAPLTAVLAMIYGRLPKQSTEWWVALAGLLAGWFITSMLTSDLVPVAVRDFTRESAIKSLGPLVMVAAVVWILVWRKLPTSNAFLQR